MSSMSLLESWKIDEKIGIGAQGLQRLRNPQKDDLQHIELGSREARSLAMLGKMAHFIAHDIRHHLSAVYSSAEFMSSLHSTSSDREELLAEVRAAVHCMTGQLDSLLQFARTGHALNPSLVSMNRLIEDSADLVRSHPDARTIDISIKKSRPIEGWLDRRRLGSAIYNLVLNACQAAKLGATPRRVEIELYEEGNRIGIRIIDSGPGVPDAIHKTLFQPFVTGEKSQRMGLGLTIAETIARDHGGDVYLENSRPGRTAFVLYLAKLALAPPSATANPGSSI